MAVEVLHELPYPTFVEKLGALQFRAAVVLEDDLHPGIQEGQFAQPCLERLEDVVEVGEGPVRVIGLGRGEEPHLGALLAGLGVAHDAQRLHRVAMLEAGEMLLAGPPDAELQPVAQRVDDRDADPVQATRNLVAVLVELPAGMKLGHDDLGCRDALLGMDIGRNPAPVVADRNRAVGVNAHPDEVGMPGQRLVDAVVDDLVDHVVQARAIIGIANIHARPLADGLQPFENLDGIRAVFGRLLRVVGHASLSLFLCAFYRPSGRDCHAEDTRFGGSAGVVRK